MAKDSQSLGRREQEGSMGATEGTHAGGEFLLRPMEGVLREHEKLEESFVTCIYREKIYEGFKAFILL